MHRRTWLKLGGLSLGALCAGPAPRLAQLLAAEASGIDRDFSIILFWAHGGPSHLETFDLKPDAPAEIRGPFRPIRTNVTGMQICEHLPRLAAMADKFTILRSLHHERGEHSGGTHRFLTGHASIQANLPNSENPEIGSIVAKHLEARHGDVPVFVGDTQFYGGGPAYLGRAYAPFMAAPNNPISASGNNEYDPIPIYPTGGSGARFSLSADSTLRLQRRADLIGQIDAFRRAVDRSGALDAWDRHHRRAVEILSSRATRDAFDLSREADSVRQRYGDSHWGKSLLTCRRLIEAGVRFVQCQATYPRIPVARTTNWDDHSVNSHIFDAYRIKLPVLDHVMSTFIDDLHARGLDRHVLFLFCGEFGRTPRIANQDPTGRPGRDHWPRAMSVFLAGGGMRMGQVIGSTNARGEHPVEKPMDSNNLLATIYRRFGIDPSQTLHDVTGRPIPILPRGEAIRELVD
jgi:Protein of unknown function (DUF1501)